MVGGMQCLSRGHIRPAFLVPWRYSAAGDTATMRTEMPVGAGQGHGSHGTLTRQPEEQQCASVAVVGRKATHTQCPIGRSAGQ